MALSVIILLAVGSDYNLLLVSRFREEIHARAQDRDHPVDGRHRWGGHGCGSGVRLHHGVHAGQRPAGARPVRFDGLHRPAARHVDRAHAADAVDRHPAGPLVLVAAGCPPARRLRRRKPASAATYRARSPAQLTQTATAPAPTCTPSTGPNGVTIAGPHAGSRAPVRPPPRCAPSGLATWCTASAAEPSPTTSQTQSIIAAVALLGRAHPLGQNEFAVVDAQQRLERKRGAQPRLGATDAPAAPQVVQPVYHDERVSAAHRGVRGVATLSRSAPAAAAARPPARRNRCPSRPTFESITRTAGPSWAATVARPRHRSPTAPTKCAPPPRRRRRCRPAPADRRRRSSAGVAAAVVAWRL